MTDLSGYAKKSTANGDSRSGRRRVGHRSVVTHNRYAHLFDERDAEIAEAVDRIGREAAERASLAPDARPLRAP